MKINKKTTRAQLDAAIAAGTFNYPDDTVFIIEDEDRLALSKAPFGVQEFAKKNEAGPKGDDGVGTISAASYVLAKPSVDTTTNIVHVLGLGTFEKTSETVTGATAGNPEASPQHDGVYNLVFETSAGVFALFRDTASLKSESLAKIATIHDTINVLERGWVVGGFAPRHTLAAYAKGARLGFNGIKMDVVHSSDNVFFTTDSALGTYNNGTGTASSNTAAALDALDAGSWFSAGYANERIPRLSHALSFCESRYEWIFLDLRYTASLARTKELVNFIYSSGLERKIIMTVWEGFTTSISHLRTAGWKGWICASQSTTAANANLEAAGGARIFMPTASTWNDAAATYCEAQGFMRGAWSVGSIAQQKKLNDLGVTVRQGTRKAAKSQAIATPQPASTKFYGNFFWKTVIAATGTLEAWGETSTRLYAPLDTDTAYTYAEFPVIPGSTVNVDFEVFSESGATPKLWVEQYNAANAIIVNETLDIASLRTREFSASSFVDLLATKIRIMIGFRSSVGSVGRATISQPLVTLENAGAEYSPYIPKRENSAFHQMRAISHRGLNLDVYPENTMIAFEAAKRAGLKIIETDVRITSDNAYVLIHDGTVDRTSNGTGNVADMTLAALRLLDFGATRGIYPGEKIVTIGYFLEWCLMNNMFAILEIKVPMTEAQINELLNSVRVLNMEEMVVFSSFREAELITLRKLGYMGWVAWYASAGWNATDTKGLTEPMAVFDVHTSWTENRVRSARLAGFQVGAYSTLTGTVSKAIQLLGVTHIITDRPSALIDPQMLSPIMDTANVKKWLRFTSGAGTVVEHGSNDAIVLNGAINEQAYIGWMIPAGPDTIVQVSAIAIIPTGAVRITSISYDESNAVISSEAIDYSDVNTYRHVMDTSYMSLYPNVSYIQINMGKVTTAAGSNEISQPLIRVKNLPKPRPLTLLNSWVAFSATTAPTIVMRSNGSIKIEGVVKDGSGVIATLPMWARPRVELQKVVVSGGASAVLTIATNGDMTISSGNTRVDLSLEI